MADIDKSTQTTLTNDETLNPSEAQGTGSMEGKARPGSDKNRPSSEVRRKKEDALEGRDQSHAKGESEPDESGHGHSEKGSSEGEGGSHTQQSLQSGQTTVQFSSGGALGGNASFSGALTSLLGLFASSATLARVETGAGILTLNQTNTLNFRPIITQTSGQSEFILNEGSKSAGIANIIGAQAAEASGGKTTIELGTTLYTHTAITTNTIIPTLVTAISTQGIEGTSSAISQITTTLTLGTSTIPFTGFSTSNTLSSSSSIFAFSNSADTTGALIPQTTSVSVGVTNPSPGIAEYFKLAGLSTSSTFGYQVLSPLLAQGLPLETQPITTGIQVSRATGGTDLTNVGTVLTAPSPASPSINLTSPSDVGIILTPSGLVYSYALNPLSALIEVTDVGTKSNLPIRFDVGPGTLVTTDQSSNLMQGQLTSSSVLRSSGQEMMIGTGVQNLNIGNGGSINYQNGSSNASTSYSTLLSNGVAPFSENTIYRHTLPASANPADVSTIKPSDLSAMPSTYGDFMGQNSITLPQPTATIPSYNLLFGRNVLDVYGTKFGEGDALTINLPTSTGVALVSPVTNTLTFGGNTLAGFGLYYGDMQTLTIAAAPGGGMSPLTAAVDNQPITNLQFMGNTLDVDNNVNSTLYPHLLNLYIPISTAGSNLTQVTNVNIQFHDSIIQGNLGSNTFYGDIQNLGDLNGMVNNTHLYNGFITGVTESSYTNSNGGKQVQISTGPLTLSTLADNSQTITGNNSIIWGNDIYTGVIGSKQTPQPNTYDFTLLGNQGDGSLTPTTIGPVVIGDVKQGVVQPIMEGNALITDFKATDTLNFQLTPALFESLDFSHNKQITAADLNQGVTFTPITSTNPVSLAGIDPIFLQYLTQIAALEISVGAPTSWVGTTISFNGGGTLTLIGLSLDTNTDDSTYGFLGLPNLGFNVNLTYVPIANTTQITSQTPATQPYLYGEGPFETGRQATETTGQYYNELDNFFANSIFAKYQVTGPNVTTQPDPITAGATDYVIVPGDTIDQFGTINVTNATNPVLINLTIQATDQQGHPATLPQQLFGFLNAPITDVEFITSAQATGTFPLGAQTVTITPPASNTTPATITITGSNTADFGIGPNIISVNGIPTPTDIVGEFSGGPSYSHTIISSAGNFLQNITQSYGSNLIVDTVGGGNVRAFGDFEATNLQAEGSSSYQITTASQTPTNQQGEILGSTITFQANAFDIPGAKAVYGVSQNVNVTVSGGNADSIQYSVDPTSTTTPPAPLFASATLDASGQFENNNVNFMTQTIYGSGPIFADMDQINISVSGGAQSSATVNGALTGNEISGTVNVQGIFSGNTITYSTNTIIIQGETPSDSSTIYANANGLNITEVSQLTRPTFSNLLLEAAATFSGNHFVFGDDAIQGGPGSDTYFGHLYSFGDPFSLSTANLYNGFVDGVTVSTVTIGNSTELKITDPNDSNPNGSNSITWGNVTYNTPTVHTAATYNYTLVSDTQFYTVGQGFDTIYNFNTSTDKIVLNVESNLFTKYGLTTPTASNQVNNATALANPSNGTFSLAHPNITVHTDTSGNSFIDFTGGGNSDAYGQIELVGTNLASSNITNLEQMAAANILQINEIGSSYTSPSLVSPTPTFDPVFINSAQTYPNIFDQFVNHVGTLSYIVTGLPAGFTLNTAGTLTADNITGPVASYASITVNDGINSLPIPPILLLGINATDAIIHNSTTSTVLGDITDSQAFDTSTTGNTVYGGGNDLTYSNTTSSNPSSTLTYGSKLIYDGSYDSTTNTGHTAFGDIQNIFVTNDGSANNQSATSHLNLTFNSNIIDTTGKIYGNVANLEMTGAGVAQITHNSFTFDDDTLFGGIGFNNFFGHLTLFGNTNAPILYGTQGFYDGVTVSTSKVTVTNAAGSQVKENSMTITDQNHNAVTWGDDTYTGGSGLNSYNFTIIPDMTNQAVGQGFDTITNFNMSTDKLVFSIAYPVYSALAGPSPLTPTGFLTSTDVSIPQLTLSNGVITEAQIQFAGGGTIDLQGLSIPTASMDINTNTSLVLSNLENITTVQLADPISAVTSPTSNLMLFGNTYVYGTITSPLSFWSTFFNTSHSLTGILPDGIVLNADGSVFNPSNTGIINITVPVTAFDSYTFVPSANSIHILAVNGAIIDNSTGVEQGDTNSELFIGQGNGVIGGGADIQYTPSSPVSPVIYNSKLIYDASGIASTVYADVQNIFFTNDGTSTDIGTTNQLLTFADNYIQASGNLYGNAATLQMTGSGTGINQITQNMITFGNDTLVGGAGNDTFYGHLVSFGNSNAPNLYGTRGFYDGVTVSPSNSIMTITDQNQNAITWGDDTYTGGSGANTYDFTIVPNMTNQAVGQGFDTITNLKATTDKLVFNIAYPIYSALAGSAPLTSIKFLTSTDVSIPQLTVLNGVITEALLVFAGGGNINLQGLSIPTTSTLMSTNAALVLSALEGITSVNLADPITAQTTLTSNMMVFGNTIELSQWQNIFNTSHMLSGSIDGITLNTDGTVNFGSNTGIIDTSVPSITASDGYTTVTSTGPITILALNGTLIDNSTGTEQGTTAADVFIGHGNAITGGGADISISAIYSPSTGGTTSSSATDTYGDKLIYNVAPLGTGDVIGDVQHLILTVQGTTDKVSTSLLSGLTNLSDTVGHNQINFGETWILSTANSSTYANVQDISLVDTGGTNIYSASLTAFTDAEQITTNAISAAGNTITAAGDAFGFAKDVTFTAIDGFYAGASGSSDNVNISNNVFSQPSNTITGTGSSSQNLFADLESISFIINSPANTNGTLIEASDFSHAVATAFPPTTAHEGNSTIDSNSFSFGGNSITGSASGGSLFSGIDQLIMENNEVTVTNASQPTLSQIQGNSITFGNTTSTASGGTTLFYGDVNDFTNTNYNYYGVTIHSTSGLVQITDNAGTGSLTQFDSTVKGNSITFGNDKMIGSASGVNIYNIDLLATTTGDAVAEGKTTIQNFGTLGTDSNENLLHVTVSKALYNDITAFNSTASSVMNGSILDGYLAHTGHESFTTGTNTLINFTDASSDNLGALLISGTPFTSFAGLGSNLEITANGANYFYAAVPGNAISSFTNNTHIIDFSGSLNLDMSNSLFTSLGLSDSNTYAQNAAVLEQSATTSKGGIHVSNLNGNTILTFESIPNLTTYGSITLHNATYSATELQNHLLITHH